MTGTPITHPRKYLPMFDTPVELTWRRPQRVRSGAGENRSFAHDSGVEKKKGPARAGPLVPCCRAIAYWAVLDPEISIMTRRSACRQAMLA
jgi:hypothetical protein